MKGYAVATLMTIPCHISLSSQEMENRGGEQNPTTGNPHPSGEPTGNPHQSPTCSGNPHNQTLSGSGSCPGSQ
ncbi:MAG: hypothetical protein WBF33_24630 [Candidatus Nitrosopolaris sp.]